MCACRPCNEADVTQFCTLVYIWVSVAESQVTPETRSLKPWPLHFLHVLPFCFLILEGKIDPYLVTEFSVS